MFNRIINRLIHTETYTHKSMLLNNIQKLGQNYIHTKSFNRNGFNFPHDEIAKFRNNPIAKQLAKSQNNNGNIHELILVKAPIGYIPRQIFDKAMDLSTFDDSNGKISLLKKMGDNSGVEYKIVDYNHYQQLFKYTYDLNNKLYEELIKEPICSP